jgi:hypothetical protein
VSGECIDAVGGEVHRTYIAQTAGFTDPQLSVESVAHHWEEVMAGSAPSLIPAGAFDPTQWDIKQYRPPQGADLAKRQ